VYLANPGGVRMKPFVHKENMDIYELDGTIDADDVLVFFGKNKGKGYDYLGILGQFFYAQKVQDDDRYFCSEFCLNAIDYALQFTLTYKLKSLKDRVGYEFNPHRLYKYLKNMELIDEKEVE
jgi:putative cytoplasmic protein